MYKIVGKKEKSVKNLGGKGFNLLKLDKFGLTPNFVIISSSIFKECIKRDYLLIDLEFIRKRILEFRPNRNFLIKIKDAIDELGINKFIIRSSFISEDSKNLSYAGLFSSYRCRKKTDIFLNVKKVWASQFTERVFNYQKEKKDFKYGMAVIIQEFIQPDFSGVVFLQQNQPQEILIEYCEKSYQAVESGTKSPFICLFRNGFLYLSSSTSKSHTEWIQNLIDLVLKYDMENKASLDIEFAVFKNKVYLLQVRPLTKKIDTKKIFFIFEKYRRWKYHLDDFSIREFKKILKEFNIAFPFQVEKRNDEILFLGDSYFSFIDRLKDKSTDLKFLNGFYRYFLDFLSLEYKKVKKIPKELLSLISNIKELNFKMSILDFIHGILIKELKEVLLKKYHLKEDKDLEYFAPPISFSTYKFLLDKNKELYGKEVLEQLDGRTKKILINNIKTNQERILRLLGKLKREQKKYFVILKKLIWLRDVVDYYYDLITFSYGDTLSLNLKNDNVRSLDICRLPLNEISKIVKNKSYTYINFLSNEKENVISPKKYTFPLRGIIASKGNFSGTARIIKNYSDIKKITPHDILISEYTRPNLVVGMAVCKGIITEEGGLTSHAAIVSRELGKPCLIGVERCTNALKDGDKIKVVDGKIYKIN